MVSSVKEDQEEKYQWRKTGERYKWRKTKER